MPKISFSFNLVQLGASLSYFATARSFFSYLDQVIEENSAATAQDEAHIIAHDLFICSRQIFPLNYHFKGVFKLNRVKY